MSQVSIRSIMQLPWSIDDIEENSFSNKELVIAPIDSEEYGIFTAWPREDSFERVLYPTLEDPLRIDFQESSQIILSQQEDSNTQDCTQQTRLSQETIFQTLFSKLKLNTKQQQKLEKFYQKLPKWNTETIDLLALSPQIESHPSYVNAWYKLRIQKDLTIYGSRRSEKKANLNSTPRQLDADKKRTQKQGTKRRHNQ